ncbi:MAG TPA: hypothetical protein GX500_05000 [Firmicutes bacterium]|nr:hypothetical protein [Candidatus Fermentithermobacillaceae bacterium]
MKASAAFPFWDKDDDYRDMSPGHVTQETPEKGLDFDRLVESVLYGAISAVAFAFGEMAADPSRGSLEDLMTDIAWAVFGALFSDITTFITGNVLLSVIIVGFFAGFLVVVLNPSPEV